MVRYNLWRVVHRLHSAPWWMLLEVKEGEPEKTPGDLWKSAVLEEVIIAQDHLSAPLSTGCYRSRRQLVIDLEGCSVDLQRLTPTPAG